jgi:hypothetical protein
MWSKRPILCVCLLKSTAHALVMAGQSSSSATETPSEQDNQPQPSKAWALCKKLSRKQVQTNPSANNAQGGPCRRSLCAV